MPVMLKRKKVNSMAYTKEQKDIYEKMGVKIPKKKKGKKRLTTLDILMQEEAESNE